MREGGGRGRGARARERERARAASSARTQTEQANSSNRILRTDCAEIESACLWLRQAAEGKRARDRTELAGRFWKFPHLASEKSVFGSRRCCCFGIGSIADPSLCPFFEFSSKLRSLPVSTFRVVVGVRVGSSILALAGREQRVVVLS